MSFAKPETIRFDVRQQLVFGVGCALLCAASWLLLFPGFVTSDSLGQLAQARQGQYSDWHPPVMSWLWRKIDHVVPGKPGMLALQLLVLWGGIFLCASALTKHFGLRVMLALVLFLFPPVLGWAGAITKDSLMLGAALVGAGLVMRLGDERGVGSGTLLWGAGMAFFVVCVVRHNGLFLVAGLALLAGVQCYPMLGVRRAVVAGMLLFLVPATGAQLLNKALTDSPAYPLASLLSFDVAGIAVGRDGDTEFVTQYQAPALTAFLLPGRQLTELRQWYQPGDWLFLATKMTSDTQGEPPVPARWEASRMHALKPLWRELVLKYPADYLAHRANVSLSLLAWGDRQVRDPACFLDRGNPSGMQIDERPALQRVLAWRLDRVVQKTPFFRPWFYYVLAWMLFVFVAIFRRPKWQIVAGLLASGLLHETALFFLSPAAEYRYSAWMMVTTLLAVFALIIGSRVPARSNAAPQPLGLELTYS